MWYHLDLHFEARLIAAVTYQSCITEKQLFRERLKKEIIVAELISHMTCDLSHE